MATLILIQFLTTVKLLVWSFFALVLPRGSPLGYEQVVRFTFDFLCIYELQFFGAPCHVEDRLTARAQTQKENWTSPIYSSSHVPSNI